MARSIVYANDYVLYSVVGRGDNDTPIQTASYGTHGSISIPEVRYAMALDDAYADSEGQKVVDRKDRAAYIWYGDMPWIADHNVDGFNVMGGAVPGKTKAYISYADGSTETYLCTDNYIGLNTGLEILDPDGNTILGHDLGMYTCTWDPQHVRITLWKRI